jgi:hypothetical protein
MRTNYRNTAEVLSLALRCAADLMPQGMAGDGAPAQSDSELGALLDESVGDSAVTVVRPDSAGRRGPMPVLHEAASGRAEALWQARRIAELRAEGVKLGQVAVVFRFKAAMGADGGTDGARHPFPVSSLDGDDAGDALVGAVGAAGGATGRAHARSIAALGSRVGELWIGHGE